MLSLPAPEDTRVQQIQQHIGEVFWKETSIFKAYSEKARFAMVRDCGLVKGRPRWYLACGVEAQGFRAPSHLGRRQWGKMFLANRAPVFRSRLSSLIEYAWDSGPVLSVLTLEQVRGN